MNIQIGERAQDIATGNEGIVTDIQQSGPFVKMAWLYVSPDVAYWVRTVKLSRV